MLSVGLFLVSILQSAFLWVFSMVPQEGWLVSAAFALDAKGLVFGCDELHSDPRKVDQSLYRVHSGEFSMNCSVSCNKPRNVSSPLEYSQM